MTPTKDKIKADLGSMTPVPKHLTLQEEEKREQNFRFTGGPIDTGRTWYATQNVEQDQ